MNRAMQYNKQTDEWEPATPMGLMCVLCKKEHTNGMSDFCSTTHRIVFAMLGCRDTERLCRWYWMPLRVAIFPLLLMFVVIRAVYLGFKN